MSNIKLCVDATEMTSTDFEAILNRAAEAKVELVNVGLRYLSRLLGGKDLRKENGTWSFDGFLYSDNALVPGRNFRLKFVPDWSEYEGDDGYYLIPSCVLDDFEVGVNAALETRRQREKERAKRIEAQMAAKEEAERALYLRLKAKFEPDEGIRERG